METQQKLPKSYWSALFILSLTAFGLGFALSIPDEQARFSDMGNLIQSHLSYALQLKDDMAVIDWSKAIEKLPSMAVFQVRGEKGLVAQGGNQDIFPTSTPAGLNYHFPYLWIFHSTFTSNGAPLQMTLVFQDQKGPLFWGLCFFIVVWGAGFALSRLKNNLLGLVPEQPAPRETHEPKNVPHVSLTELDPQNAALVLDKDYLIRQATPKAAEVLGRELSDLTNSHFLDLLPDPTVMKAIDEGQETRLLKPFPSHPQLSARLKPMSHGMTLFLEVTEGTERA